MRRFVSVGVVAIAASSSSARADEEAKPGPGIDDQLDAGEAENAQPAAQRKAWNELDLSWITFRLGGGLLLDWVTYDQSAASHEQMPLEAAEQVRDFRILLKGKFPKWARLSYTLGYMYNGPTQTWHFRQTGLMVAIPELAGQLFVGRTKEGFSTNKMMVGYFGWTIERAAANEAFLPILADGVKWTGQLFDNRIVYNAGVYFDQWSETESFNKNDKQFVGRVVGLPFAQDRSGRVLQLVGEVRLADSNDGFLQYRSKPEAFPAQSYAVDTGKFAADSSVTIGAELYYRPGPLMFGSEYFFNKVQSAPTRDPLFHGGEAFLSYLITGEVHPYNEKGAFFEGVSPAHSVYSGGIGAWEVVIRGSYVDLDSGTITGGKFWRITPVLSWYLSDNIRLETEYGYSRLDRFGVEEPTHYIQARLQLVLM